MGKSELLRHLLKDPRVLARMPLQGMLRAQAPELLHQDLLGFARRFPEACYSVVISSCEWCLYACMRRARGRGAATVVTRARVQVGSGVDGDGALLALQALLEQRSGEWVLGAEDVRESGGAVAARLCPGAGAVIFTSQVRCCRGGWSLGGLGKG